ncbi:MAG: 4Fe-4S ferredoxin [Candidatus Sedimenticola endophacoides]|uniref:4Fe-4S ferredoxin n=1 Tax=Candidatus Sedimenticola endophacoides TaxID=2548426 RepID=A0A657Q4X6_9GAMM|nr:MAG: 4Fe-4S ferredoxin [Candidatus Sedimenticola endophacoides]OQX36973.1 MAG: 4Fe-4S ferredoxin [Candidatus Sedimenticola endophacoides]OQX39541.1 MAG: 4Fe-4S ferredoxin [Candidatus Sedimenticola endophacoides]OQX41381.1 MAG: 4Fe-4S ferredoxin [Candidatus Sedimenticola endophacoides]OQX43814.1 MAG: 4Fe-4S ferredoxin [Candidatus Sedimenticola endophacoides]
MNPLKNLSVIRKLVQLTTFVFFIYGGFLGSYYLADKVSGALPALHCAYNMDGADLCTLVPFQHQMDHRLGPIIAQGGNLLMGLMPTLITLGTFLLFFVFLNKAFCGWICPVGTFQELLHILGQKLGLRRTGSLDEETVRRTRPVKWAILGLLVFGFPLLTGLGWLNHDMGDPFCRICPSRILSTLAAGDTSQLYVDTATTTTLFWSLVADFLFGLMIAMALTIRLPFCRICPMLALHAVFRKLGLLRLVKNPSPRCGKCGLCAKACPMDIREIHTEMDKHNVTFEDCTLCGRCVEFCPDKDVLQLKYTVFPLFSADPQYFKVRKKAQTEWEKKTLFGNHAQGVKKSGAKPT